MIILERMKVLTFMLILSECLQYYIAAADFQVAALVEMRKQLNDANGVLNGWMDNQSHTLNDWKNNQMSPCYWDHVTCQDDKVTALTLSSSALTGILSPSIGKLTTLEKLLLDGNYIYGGIPQELGNLSSLEVLSLGTNDLSGSIPDIFGRLKKLQKLDLSRNRLSGNIPSTLSGLQSLNYINLADNNLSGDIPVQLFQVAQYYDFTGNTFNCDQRYIPCQKDTMNAGHKGMLWIIAVVVPLVAALTCFISFFRWVRKHRKGRWNLKDRVNMNVHQDEELELGIEGNNSVFKIFNFSQVLEATKNFSVENKLGQGGFGPVYKGQFPDGVEVAVKRLAVHSGQGLTEFKNEIQLIAKLQHTNLVRLLGCCYQGQEKILVYEYLPNKSLDFFIFDDTRRALVDWNKRLSIIDGIAQGLLYLHKHSRLRVIHRDLKAGNILLDHEMNPKISDFGLAKIFSANDTEANTNRIVGTYGYMAPEYASEGLFSVKSDVFSFGVLVLEIISGKRTSSFHGYGEFINLLGHAWQMWKDGIWLQLIDTSIVNDSHTQMMRCINIALLCVQENAIDRPTMSEVVAMLNNESMPLPEPKHPAFFNMRVMNEETSTGVVALASVNGITLSAIDGR